MNPLTMVQSFREAGFDQKQAETLAYVTDRAAAHLVAKIDKVQADITAKIDGGQSEPAEFKTEGGVDFANIRTEMLIMENRLIRRIAILTVGLFILTLGVTLGILL